MTDIDLQQRIIDELEVVRNVAAARETARRVAFLAEYRQAADLRRGGARRPV